MRGRTVYYRPYFIGGEITSVYMLPYKPPKSLGIFTNINKLIIFVNLSYVSGVPSPFDIYSYPLCYLFLRHTAYKLSLYGGTHFTSKARRYSFIFWYIRNVYHCKNNLHFHVRVDYFFISTIMCWEWPFRLKVFNQRHLRFASYECWIRYSRFPLLFYNSLFKRKYF